MTSSRAAQVNPPPLPACGVQTMMNLAAKPWTLEKLMGIFQLPISSNSFPLELYSNQSPHLPLAEGITWNNECLPLQIAAITENQRRFQTQYSAFHFYSKGTW